MIKIECPRCKFVTEFELFGDVYKRNIIKHGNDEARLACFNCNEPLEQPKAKKATVKIPAEKTPVEVIGEHKPVIEEKPKRGRRAARNGAK